LVGNKSEGRPLATKGITRLKHLWDIETKAWKTMSILGLHKHPTNVLNKDRIIFGFILPQPFFTLGIGLAQKEEEMKKIYPRFTRSLTLILATWRMKNTQGKQLMACSRE
jgi:hypothetical protein